MKGAVTPWQPLVFLSINILFNSVESVLEHFGMKNISLYFLERRCIVVTVAYTLIRNNSEGYEAVTLTGSVTLYGVRGKYISV